MLGAAGIIAQHIPGVQFLLALSPNVSREQIEALLRREQERGGTAQVLQLMQQAGGKIRRAASSALHPPGTVLTPGLATNEGFVLRPPQDTREQTRQPRSEAAPATLTIVEDMTYDAMGRSDVVISVSGTATLEAAILNRPVIIIYRGTRLMEMEYYVRKRFQHFGYIGLPNILANEMVCPELIQHDASPERISDIAVEWLLQPERLMHMKERLSQTVAENLGTPGAVRRSARIFLDEIGRMKTR
jgi:lipid-A-disaccharide synthase